MQRRLKGNIGLMKINKYFNGIGEIVSGGFLVQEEDGVGEIFHRRPCYDLDWSVLNSGPNH